MGVHHEFLAVAIDSFLENLVHQADVLVLAVAYSGGLDSTVLLHCLARRLEFSSRIRLKAVHVHHGLSPHADTWLLHCSQFAQSLNLSIETIKVAPLDIKSHGLEDAARRMRYLAFESVVADFVLLAHHADDQAETVLLNVLRGCGILGLSGIPQIRGKYIRPLLNVPQSVLRDYALAHRLRWCEDESNGDARYSRNYLRAVIFPKLLTKFPGYLSRLNELSKHAASTQSLLMDLAIIDLGGGTAPFFPIYRERLTRLSPDRIANALRVALQSEGLQSANTLRLFEFVRQILEARSDRHPCLETSAWKLTLTKGKVWLLRNSN